MRIIELKLVGALVITIIIGSLFVAGVYTLGTVYPDSLTDTLLFYTGVLLILLVICLWCLYVVPDKDYKGNP